MSINQLRQQALFNGYGMGLPNLNDYLGGSYGYGYGEEEQSPQPRNPAQISLQVPEQRVPFPVTPFGGATQGAPPPQIEAPQVSPIEPYGRSIDDMTAQVMASIGKVYTPSTVDRDRFRGLLDDYPERNDPSLMRRITASMVAAGDPQKGGGMAGAENVLYAPYMRDLAAWKEKTGPFGNAAQYENTANNTERQLATGVVSNLATNERTLAQARAAELKAETERQRTATTARIANQRQYLNYLISTKTVDSIIKDGPTVVAQMKDGSRIDTGIPSDSTNDLELAALNNAAKMSQIVQGGVQDRMTKAAPADLNPKQETEDFQNRISLFFIRRPQYQEFIETKNGTYQFKPRPVLGEGIWWNDVKQDKVDKWDAMMKEFDPNYVPPSTSGGGQNQPPQPPQVQPPQVSPESKQGLGPTTVPQAPPSVFSGPAPTPNPVTWGGGKSEPFFPPRGNIRVIPNTVDPNFKSRTIDGGKTWEASSDGGTTWKPLSGNISENWLRSMPPATILGMPPSATGSSVPPTGAAPGMNQRLEVVDTRTGKVVGTVAPEQADTYVGHPYYRVRISGGGG